ncbi:NAD(P)-binding domain-containing protein [Mesorhizobium sp. B2-3-4]|uniref:ornithine cyclodeaminase family protein n=1 Tax=Mesorhizobium sp. B2-3-4 TaxID=2589959 RepID=UPI00112C3598|nr:NAD(P)-binding domain-containing protein [Mesorhizobium sp. B2-3-4]TPM40463.1 ornithine cyclodeaminase family protein [Mesorhizobium sp. B2-3-4]
MSRTGELLYLSRDDVLACSIGPSDLLSAVSEAFKAKATRDARTAKPMSFEANGGYFDGKGGYLDGFSALKWYGYFSGNAERGLRDFWPMIIVSEAQTGLPVAFIDGTWISEVRTAAISAAGATRLAASNSHSIAFIACGQQARSHLQAFGSAFPLKRVVAYGRRAETAETFAEEARAMGYEAEVATTPRLAVEDADIVITSVPHKTLKDGFLDVSWLKPDVFVSMVDLGYSWLRSSFGGIDLLATDDREQVPPGRGYNTDRVLTADLSDLLAEPAPGQERRGRRALVFAGSGLADVAVARLVVDTAKDKGMGRLLPL